MNDCPFCEAEEKGCSEGWAISPEGWEEQYRVHLKEHCVKCPTCGHYSMIQNPTDLPNNNVKWEYE